METRKKSNINIRIDADLKAEAIEFFNELGLDMTSAITLFIKQSLFDNELPFKPSLKREPNAETAKAMLEALNGDNVTEYSSVGEWWQSYNED